MKTKYMFIVLLNNVTRYNDIYTYENVFIAYSEYQIRKYIKDNYRKLYGTNIIRIDKYHRNDFKDLTLKKLSQRKERK